MAVLPTDREREEQDLMAQMEQMAPQTSGGLGTGQGTPGTLGLGGEGGVTPTGTPRPEARAGGGGFVNTQQYVDANRDATQRLGQGVSGVISGAGDRARGAISTGQQGFNTAVGAGEVLGGEGFAQQISSDPTQIANDPTRLAEVQRARDAQYTGPRQLEDTDQYAAIAQALAEARQTGALASSESGVSELSDRAMPGQRTAGGRAFDSRLLMGDDTARSGIESSVAGLGSLDSDLASASTASRARAQQGEANTNQTRGQVQGALQSSQAALSKSLDDRLGIARQQALQRQAMVKQALDANENRAALPTTGGAGYYDPGKGTGAKTESIAGEVPSLIHKGAGQGALPGFNEFLSQRAGPGPGQEVLDALGLSAQEWAALSNLAPAGEYAAAGAAGTNNVNPYVFLDDFEDRTDLRPSATYRNPDAEYSNRNIAQAGDYDRMAALDAIGGTQSGYLNANERGMAGQPLDDLVDFDKRSAALNYLGAMDGLAERTGNTVAGNRRSGGDTFFKEHGAQIASGGIAPRGAQFDAPTYIQTILNSLNSPLPRKTDNNTAAKGADTLIALGYAV